MYKVVTVYKRKPGMEVEAFQQRWFDTHGPIVARLPDIRRHVQSHCLVQGYRKGELACDGIGEMWFDSREDWERAKRDPAFEAVIRDESEFVDPSRKVIMPVEVLVIKDGAIPSNAVKNIEFVNRRPGMQLHAFRAYWRNVHGPLASRIVPLRRYEQNHLQLHEYEGAQPAPAYDGLAITWFESTAAMKEGATSSIYAETRADEANFLPDGHLPFVVTREREVAIR